MSLKIYSTAADDGDVQADCNPGGICDAFGDSVISTANNIRVGDFFSPVTQVRWRGFYVFDISSLSGPVNSAVLWVFYNNSWGPGGLDTAPDSAEVGHVIVDHLDDYTPLDKTDYEAVAKSANIGTIIGDDVAATMDWHTLDVTAQVNIDIGEAGTPDNSCFRLRQSVEGVIGLGERNEWRIRSGEAPGGDFTTSAHLLIEGGQIMMMRIT